MITTIKLVRSIHFLDSICDQLEAKVNDDCT